ncbi:hypothetical protein AB0D83_00220 [Streptomyces decoyicus]|uniref:hypothetical protein n=1 Tax=Streptomyces decoyicus TaxID=249567 RepID=UPI0033C1169C
MQLQRELVPQLHIHPYWDTLSGPALVTARMKLKHVDQARRSSTSIKHVDDQAEG